MKTTLKLNIVALGLMAATGASLAVAQSTPGIAPPPASSGPVGSGRGGRGPALGGQPRMEAALLSLQEAKRFLESAVADKGGFREKAIKDVDDAIADTKAGIEYARAHPEEFGRGARGAGAAAAARAPGTK